MKITSSREADYRAKLEGNTGDGKNKYSSSSSTSWLKLKDPRIVRVSRAFGGKDRHSKVRTVRGLRDRRVRLSVSTAIQLYDLQERLGLNQPSKVVDWLLNAAKHEIEGLPPLQIPVSNFVQNHNLLSMTPYEVAAYSLSNKDGLKTNTGVNCEDPTGILRSNFWNSDALLRRNSKEIARGADEKENWKKRKEEEKQDHAEGQCAHILPSNNLFLRPNHSSLPGLLNNVMPCNSYCHWEPSSLSNLSHGFTSQTADLHNFNVVPLSSTLPVPSGSQIFMCPPGTTTQSYFSPSHVTSPVDTNPRPISHFQALASSSQNLLPDPGAAPLFSLGQSLRSSFPLTMHPKLIHSQKNSTGTNQSSKDTD